MKLNRVETLLMNNPVRSFVQQQYEARLLERLGGRTVNLDVLEIGCGRGVGTEIILQRFGARRVFAFDFDARMAELARRRLTSVPPSCLFIGVADAVAIPVRTASFDGVFDFGAIHHVPNWRAAVSEIRRVLRPGGRFFFDEVTRDALNRWAYRRFLEHPRARLAFVRRRLKQPGHSNNEVTENRRVLPY